MSGLADTAPADAAPFDTNKIQVKNKTTQRVNSKKATPLEDHLAVELVARFHSLRKHSRRAPSAKEVGQAKSLLAELGQSRAHFVLDFAIAEARRTRFEMRYFGAIFQYLEEALARFETERARLASAAAARKETEEEERRLAYSRWRSQEVNRLRQGMAPAEMEALTKRVRSQLAERSGGRQTIGFEAFVSREVDGLIAEAHDLPPYETWREQEYPWLRRLAESASSETPDSVQNDT
jgi:hypothetical protein